MAPRIRQPYLPLQGVVPIGVPEAPWGEQEARLVAVFRSIPAARQGLALRLLEEMGREG